MPADDTEPQWEALATYNAEVARGVVHTDKYDFQMAAEQARFRAWSKEKYGDRFWMPEDPAVNNG